MKKGDAAAKHPEWLGARIREQPDPGSICSQQREVDCSLSSAAGTLNSSLVSAGTTVSLQCSQPQRASVLCVSGHRLLCSPTGHFSFPKPLGAAPVGTEQGAEAEPGLFGHSREPHQHRMFPWSTTGPRTAVHSAKCRDTTLPKQTAGTCGGPRSVLQYPPDPSLPSAPAHADRGEATVPLSLLTPPIHLSSRRCPDDRQDHNFQAIQGKGYSPHLEGMDDVFMAHVSGVLSFGPRLVPCVSLPAMREGMYSTKNVGEVRAQQK